MSSDNYHPLMTVFKAAQWISSKVAVTYGGYQVDKRFRQRERDAKDREERERGNPALREERLRLEREHSKMMQEQQEARERDQRTKQEARERDQRAQQEARERDRRAQQEARDEALRLGQESAARLNAELAEKRREELEFARGEHELLIDTNIWMDPVYEKSLRNLCLTLGGMNTKLRMHGEQYDEMERKRKRTEQVGDRTDGLKPSTANRAIHLIRDLSRLGQLALIDTRQQGMHVDDYFRDLVASCVKSNMPMLFVTDDIRLQTRVFSVLPISGGHQVRALLGAEFNERFGG